jgi:TonB-dependent receptor
MRSFLSFLLAVVCSLVLNSPVGAQSGKGTITGIVKDSGNSALQGALVELLPSGRKVVTDDHGQFRITDVPAGEYTVSVSYVGLAVSNVPVVVSAGQEASANAVLQVASQVDQVIVSAERLQGEAEAINIERTADNIVQVLPERVIVSLPNTNIADAVGRVPSVSLERDEGEGKYVQIRGTEPRLSSVTVNGVNLPSVEGVVRNIKLDAVPADLVERIEVFKTLSASQDADGVGGTVNLVTRTPGERPFYAVGGTGGYNPIQNGYGRGGLSGTFGQRFGVNKKFGFLLNGTFDKTNRGIDDLEPGQTTGVDPATGRNVAFSNTEDRRSYNYYRTRYGFSTGIDYNVKPGVSVYAKGLFSDFHDYGETWVFTPNAGNTIKSVSADGSKVTFDNAQDCATVNQAADVANPGSNPCSPGSYNYRHYVRRPDQQIYSFLTGARHDLASTLITYEFAASRSHNIGGQDFATTNFNGAAASYGPTGILLSTGPDIAVNQTDPHRPKLFALDNTNLYDPTQYLITNSSFTSYIAQQLNFQGAASAARRYNAHSHLGTFELGIKIRNSHSVQHESDTILKATDASGNSNIALSSVLGGYTNPSSYDNFFRIGSQAYGPTSNYSLITKAVLGNPAQFAPDLATDIRRSAGAIFDANERIYAGYLQNVISFGKLRLQTGVRFDAADTGFLANTIVTSDPADPTVTPTNPRITPNRQNASYFNALPSVQAQYQLQRNTNLRANYSQGIARPNIGDLVPTTIVDPNANPAPGVVTQGNPNLKPTKANNYDLLIEHFFQPLGILQAGYFYKQLSDPIYPTASTIPAGQPNAGLRLLQSINGPSAHIQGIEVTWEQRFSFLPGLLNGFGVSANYSYTQSGVTFPTTFDGGRIDNAPLSRQAPNTWNAGFTYDKARLSMRFAASHNDANIAFYNYSHVDAATDKDPILGLRGPGGDVYFYAHTQFDIQGSYRIRKGLRFEASGLNLSNEVFGFYQGSGIYPIQREFYKPTVSFGFRWTSSSE